MTHRFKVGNVYLELPEGSTTSFSANPKVQPTKSEQPETPEPLEEPQYIYRPNDPFQASIDEARAISSIRSSHSPWVRKTWFALFVIGPLVYAQLFALALAQHETGWGWIKAFAGANVFIMPIWLIYFSIWRRKARTLGR